YASFEHRRITWAINNRELSKFPLDWPVEFEKQVAEEAGPFGLDKFITQLTGRKKPVVKVGS
ncbi:hypothetical protein Tco_0482249, partial [Tanacetum coccineum]